MNAAMPVADTTQRRFERAVASWQAGAIEAAEAMLRDLLAAEPAHAQVALQLAIVLRDQGRIEAAVDVAERAHASTSDCAWRTRYLQFVIDCRRQHRALWLCERQLLDTPRDANLLARAGMLAQETGRFELARHFFLAALDAGVDLAATAVQLGLAHAQRYDDPFHPDFDLLRRLLRTRTAARERTATLFAFGKACDDVGDFAAAATAFRQANRSVRAVRPWSADAWRRRVDATIADTRALPRLAAHGDAVPVLIVGLPRTGTTLLAELLGRHPQIRNRGELPLLDVIAKRLEQENLRGDIDALREASALYLAHLRQDDARVCCYIDKDPLNFRHLGLVAQLLPQARIIHCVRDARDTALSLWMQCFAQADYGFCAGFADIAAFAEGHRRLMQHWSRDEALHILRVDYEAVVKAPARELQRVLEFLRLSRLDLPSLPPAVDATIASASRWQARQPVYRRSVGRWRAYADLLPELALLQGKATGVQWSRAACSSATCNGASSEP
ncbi:MAG: sulfotransferase [Dokdonella sp.]